MSKQEKKGLVPTLRFPEFREKGEWIEKPLNKITTSIFDGTHQTPKYTDEGIPFFSVENIISGKANKFISKEDYLIATSKNKPERGDILITRIGNIGFSTVVDWDYEFSIYVTLAVVKSDERFNSHYLHSFMQSDRYQMEVQSKSLLNAVPCKINMEELRKTTVLLPCPDEQQKIADCLTSIDELITAQTQKLAALKTHKKGLLQQLFPAEGETVPRLRFPEFLDKGEWVLQKLEGVAKRGSGHTPNKQMSNYYNGGIRWVSLADSNKLDNRYIYATKIQISKEGIENSSAVLHPAGAVILSRDAGVGKSAVLYSEMAVSQHFIAWVCDESKLSNWFLYYVLQILKPAFERVAVGNTIKTIGLPYFKELCISVPTISEQQKIADCLASIDDLITAQTQKLAALKTHKKGLMQQLFPAMDEDCIDSKAEVSA